VLYPASLWNLVVLQNSLGTQEVICRTNNHLERYNRKLNENLKTHDIIINLVEFLKQEHEFYRSHIIAVRDGDKERKIKEIDIPEDPLLTEILKKANSKLHHIDQDHTNSIKKKYRHSRSKKKGKRKPKNTLHRIK